MESRVSFDSEGLQLEGLLIGETGQRAAILTHPHPLYGGEMHNPVVATAARAYRKIGCSTLRFNFRGVGDSRGAYDDGKGEQQDVLAALTYLRSLGYTEIDLVGYSFGAWVNAHLESGAPAGYERLVMISPPVAFMDFSQVSSLPRLALVAAGSRDDIGPPDLIRKSLKGWNPNARFEVVPGADHFFSEALEALETVLLEALQN